jgi:hypothetical protein
MNMTTNQYEQSNSIPISLGYRSELGVWVMDCDSIIGTLKPFNKYTINVYQINSSSGWLPSSEPNPNMVDIIIPEFIMSDFRIEKGLMDEGFKIENDIFTGDEIYVWYDATGNRTFKARKDYQETPSSNTIIKGKMIPYNDVF